MTAHPLLLERIRVALLAEGVCAEAKKMFGGVAFMVNGHMGLGVTNKGDLMVRIPPERNVELLAWNGARPMDFTGRPMKGFLFVDPIAVEDANALTRWVQLVLDHVRTLPAKVPGKKANKSGEK